MADCAQMSRRPIRRLPDLRNHAINHPTRTTNDIAQSPQADEPREQAPRQREVRFEHSPDFPHILEHLGVSLLISTYQAGKLVVVGARHGKLTFAFHSYERVMGLAASSQRIAVGTRRQVFFLQPAHELAPRVEPAGEHDACWLARSSLVTGNIHGHELAWGRQGLWVVNTLFSCLATLDDQYSFVPRWRPPFISELAAQDRCHLNGLAMEDGQPRFVTAHGETNEPAGWRPGKAHGGCVIDVAANQVIARGLSMPHSPRLYNGRLWVLDSGRGRMTCLVRAASPSATCETVEELPGFTRGLAFAGQFAFVGLSKIRETAVFGGLPIAERRQDLRCGVAIVDLVSGRAVASLQFHSGVEEIFAVEVLPGCLNPVLTGPSAEDDGQPDIWLAPPEGKLGASPALFRAADMPPSSTSPASAAPSAVAGRSPVEHAQQLVEQAHLLRQQGRLVEALDRFKQAVAAAPERAEWLNELGNLHQDLGDQDSALTCYRRAVAAQPGLLPAHQNLGYLLFNHGQPREALAHYEAAQRLQPSPMNQLLAATVLPVVYESQEDVETWRQRLTQSVRRLLDDGVRIDTRDTMIPTNFFAAYQGENDRELMRDLGRIYTGPVCVRGDVAAAATSTAAFDPESAVTSLALAHRTDGGGGSGGERRRLRVGFLSAYFRDHTIGRLNLGRVRHLSREQFEVTVIYAARQMDEMTRAFQQAADRFVVLPRSVAAARQQITDLGLDLLLFADVGMDSLTYTLAFSRMAPVQCVTWGHPDTTGSPAIDYFLSSELLEEPDGDEHYTERLVRLPSLGTYYERPELPTPREDRRQARESFGLSADRNLYLCPQTLFKFHPAFDPLLAEILRADPHGELLLLEGRVPQWTKLLRERFQRTMPDVHTRVRFLPAQPRGDFLRLLAAADMVLDPLPFGGGNTSYEALAVGTPVVTLPGRYLRGRITAALYQKMRMLDCVSDSPDQYVRLATRLGADPAYQQAIRKKILATCGVLFDDAAEVRDLERCLLSLVDRAVVADAALV
jgi:protein O-GlcNAc transferase